MRYSPRPDTETSDTPELKIDSEDRLVTKKQAAERLAVSTRTIDRMVSMRQLEKIYVGPSPRFRKSDLDRIVERGI